uniref:Uncharacterized protein n=1 Tax=Arion vulgaris TaxID=1028688 RepID=A0A0B7AZQ7_9EUPU
MTAPKLSPTGQESIKSTTIISFPVDGKGRTNEHEGMRGASRVETWAHMGRNPEYESSCVSWQSRGMVNVSTVRNTVGKAPK